MKKHSLKRIFLKTKQGQYFRIFSITNPSDKHGERYIKAIFPEMRNVPLITETNDQHLNVLEQDIAWKGVQEFSFHYHAGVSHYKDGSDSYLDRMTALPKLKDVSALHLFRFNVYNTGHFEPKKESKITDEDFVIHREFDGRARGLEVGISYDHDIRIVAKPEEQVMLYKFALEDESVVLFVTDGFWLRRPMTPNVYAEIFRYDNPTAIFKGQ